MAREPRRYGGNSGLPSGLVARQPRKIFMGPQGPPGPATEKESSAMFAGFPGAGEYPEL